MRGREEGAEKNMARIRKCEACGEYTLKKVCVRCGAKTVSPLPPRFSPTDRYGKYRRMLKKERGILSSAASDSSGEKMKDIEAERESGGGAGGKKVIKRKG